ncbi:MAG: hypothetical protein JJV98_05010 [Desulfosarcina sp.]|nr:hypothetical protein [Desulfobacterales bacterium]
MIKPSMLITVLAILLVVGCASDPVHYAEFGAVDRDESDIVEWYEFKAFYPQASPKSFMEADQNKDGEISADEWHDYIERYRP